jgi:hypothetical protein
MKILQPTYFAHPFGHPGAFSSIGLPGTEMQWCSSSMMPNYPI